MTPKYQKFSLIFSIILLVSFSSQATDFTENDLSAPINDTNNYTNVTVQNTNDLSSSSLTVPYIYFAGTVDGDISLTNSGSIASTDTQDGVLYLGSVGNTSSLKTISITNSGSLSSTGTSVTSALQISGKTDGFPSVRRSFAFSLNNDSGTITSATTGLYVQNGATGTHNITNSGTISNTASSDGYMTIILSGGSEATITNSGTIQANSTERTAINLNATSSTISNNGSGVIRGIINASGNSDTSMEITNNSSDGITGNITTSSANLDVINSAGTITGNITLGNNADSSIAINGGSILGNITMNNASQTLTFANGTLSGTVNGAGQILVNADTTLNGNIGNSTSLTSITIAATKTLNALTNSNSIAASNITLGSGSVLTMGSGALSGNVDGTANNRGTLNMTFSTNSNVNAVIGENNSLARVNFTSDSGAAITANQSIKATEVKISGVDGSLTLGSSKGIYGNAIIGDRSNLVLGDNSFVNGTIQAEVNNSGALQTTDGSSYNITNDIGTSSLKLHEITLINNSTLTTSAKLYAQIISISNDSTLTTSSIINGDSITLSSDATLDLTNGANVTANIESGGILFEGIVQTSGEVSISGTIGSSSAISELNIQSGSILRLNNKDSSGANTIEATDVNITGELDLIDATTIHSNVTMIGSSSKVDLRGYSHSITGNFTTASGSTIVSTIHSAGSIDSLTVAGVATLDSNTKLSLTISGITPGSSYTLIDGGSGSSISAISNSNIYINGVNTNRFGNYIFSTSVLGNDLILNSTLSTPPSTTTSNESIIYNNIAIANAGSSGNLYTMQQYVLGDASNSSKDAALDSALPEVNNASNRSIFNSANSSLDISSNQLQSFYNGNYGVASGDEEIKKDNTFWTQAFGSNINQGNTPDSEGYKSNIKGFAFGANKEINNSTLIGISASYSNSSVKSRSGLKHNSINSYQINGYGGYYFNNYFINGLAGFAWNDFKSNRYIPLVTSNANANYHGQTYIARIESGITQKLKHAFVITPTITITAAHNRVDNYSEEGAGTLNLEVRNNSSNFFETRAGIALKRNFHFLKYNITPEIFLSYGYDFAGSKQRTNSNFVGQTTSFNSAAANIARGSFKSGISTKIFSSETISFLADYVYEKRLDYHANSASLKASYKF